MAGDGNKFLKYGCFGCVGVLLLMAVVAGGLVAVASMQAKGDKAAERQVETELPPALRTEVAVGTVRLDLSGGAFRIQPGSPGEPIRAKARYSEGRGELVEKFTEATEDSGWIYELSFRHTSSGFLDTLRQMFGGVSPEVDIYLPPDVPFALELTLTQGGGEVELGNLWITEGEFEFAQGGVNLDFGEPLKQPMRKLWIDGSMGGFNLARIGNASPEHFRFDGSMGGMNVDLRGAWRNDAEIEIDLKMGGGTVQLPRDVTIQGLDDSVFRVEEPSREIPVPVLRFERTSGELDFRY